MRLLRIEMKNFRQYKNQTILFPDEGLIGIVGKNGSGKSTLFNAIGWSLYGKIKNVTSNMIKNQAADKKESCYVEIDFLFNGKYHRIHRNMISSKCFADVDGVRVAIGTSHLNQFVEEDLFKMDYRAFSICYYAQQDEFDALAKAKPAERAQIISKLLRIESIDKAAEATRRDFRELEKEVSESKRFLKDEEALHAQQTAHAEQIKSIEAQLQQKASQAKQKEESIKTLLFEKSAGDQAYETFRGLVTTLEKLQDRMETIQKSSLQPNQARLQQLQADEAKFETSRHALTEYPALEKRREAMLEDRRQFQEKQRLQREVAHIEKQAAAYRDEYTSIKNQLMNFTSVDEQIAAKEKEQQTQEDLIVSLRDRLQEWKYTLTTMKNKRQEMQETQKKFEELGSEAPCPTCERPLGEHHEDKMQQLAKELKTLDGEIAALETKMVSLSEEGKQAVAIKNNLVNEVKALRQLEMEQSNLKERERHIKKEMGQRKEQFETLQQQLSELSSVTFDEQAFSELLTSQQQLKPVYEWAFRMENSLKEIPSLLAQIENISTELKGYQQEKDQTNQSLKELAFDETAYRQLTGKIEQLQADLQHHQKEELTMAGEIRVLQTEIKNIEDKVAENQLILTRIREKETSMTLLAKLDQVYKAYKKDKLTKVAPALSGIISDLMDIITDGKYDLTELDEEYNISIFREGVKNPLSFYSGGEQKLAALCQRLAVSKVLSSQVGQATFEMLSMDEVFGSMDDERQDKLIETLRNLNQLFPQILCVSHSENVKTMFDYLLVIEVDAKGASTSRWETDWDSSRVAQQVDEYEDSLTETIAE